MKKKRFLADVVTDMVRMYFTAHVSRSAASLAYFLTLSVFPMIICLSAMLGNLLPDAETVLAYIADIVPTELMQIFSEYIVYVTSRNSSAMLTAGLVLMATSSGAAYRSLHNVMAEVHGKARFTGVSRFIMSFIFSFLFLATIYFAVTVIMTGEWFLQFLEQNFLHFSVSRAWNWVRFIILFCLLVVIIYGVYRLAAPREDGSKLMPGAIAAAFVLVAVSILFSWFINMSVRYPLVYGSLASIIILMVWLYVCGNVLIMGNVFNVALMRHAPEEKIV